MTELIEDTEGEDMIDSIEFEAKRKRAMMYLAKLTGKIDQETYNVLVDFVGRQSICATTALTHAEEISEELRELKAHFDALLEQSKVVYEEGCSCCDCECCG